MYLLVSVSLYCFFLFDVDPSSSEVKQCTLFVVSGANDPRCKVCIFMGKTDRGAQAHRQQSMIIVPMDAPGVTILRALHVFGSQDAPRE